MIAKVDNIRITLFSLKRQKFSLDEKMHANNITSSDSPSNHASQNKLEIIETLNEEADSNLHSRNETFADEGYVKPNFLYTIHGVSLNEKLYRTIAANCVERMERSTSSNNINNLFILTSYFLLQNENLGMPVLFSTVKDTLIPLLSGMDIENLNIFWETIKTRTHLSVNHSIDGNNPRRRYLPLREPVNRNIPKSLDLFLNACLLDLRIIQRHEITKQLTLKHVICEENDYLLYKLMRKELIGINYSIYCRQFNKFLRFKEIIKEQMKRVSDRIFLMQILEGSCIHLVYPENRVIILTDDCVKCVVKYLNNDDIRNMIVAFDTNIQKRE